LRNPGLYSLISLKSAAADEKRTLVGNDTTSGSFTVDNHISVALQYKQEKKPLNIAPMSVMQGNLIKKFFFMTNLKIDNYGLTAISDYEMSEINGGGWIDKVYKLLEKIGAIDAALDAYHGFTDGYKAGYSRGHGAGGSW